MRQLTIGALSQTWDSVVIQNSADFTIGLVPVGDTCHVSHIHESLWRLSRLLTRRDHHQWLTTRIALGAVAAQLGNVRDTLTVALASVLTACEHVKADDDLIEG